MDFLRQDFRLCRKVNKTQTTLNRASEKPCFHSHNTLKNGPEKLFIQHGTEGAREKLRGYKSGYNVTTKEDL